MRRGFRWAKVLLPLLIVAATVPREPPMRDTLAAVDAALAADDAGVVDGRPEMLWVDADRLLFRADVLRLDVSLVRPSSPAPVAIATDNWLRPALAKLDITGPVTLDGLSADGATLYLRHGVEAVAVDLARRTAAPDATRTRAIRDGRPRTISDQFPTTFGPLIENASPDGRRFVGAQDGNVYVRDADGGPVRMLTNDGRPDYAWLGTEESAEGLNALWSPDGTRIAAVRLDSRGVAREPLMRWLSRAPTVDRVAYPRAGDPIHRFELAVFDARDGRRVAIESGDTTDHYVNLLGWLANGRSLLYQVVDREQKHLAVFRADAATGRTRPILTENRATYIDTPMTLAPTLVHPLPGGGFLYLSERDGWRHIYRYDDDGRPVRRLTRGAWAVENIVRIDDGFVYFHAARDARYAASLYRVALAGGAAQLIAGGGNVSREAFAPDGRHVALVRSGPTQPPVVELRGVDGSMVATLSAARLAPGLPAVEQATTRSVDSRFAMDGLILRPAGFDPAKHYPVVEIIYGGMQLDFLPRDAYATGWWLAGVNGMMGRILANRGYVVVYANAPGTPGRGRAFQDATYGIWPQTVIANHAKFLRDIARSRPWMDLGRVGIFGNSWGGYMVQRALIDAPDLYRAAVSFAPASDFVDHPTYIEPFMGLPRRNPAGYAAGSNLARLNEIRGSILVVPEPLDVNAGFSPSMKLVDGMIRAGGDVELFTMPDVNHHVNCCGWPRERYAYAIALRYIDRKLGF